MAQNNQSDEKNQIKGAMTEFLNTNNSFFDYVGYISPEGKEIVGVCFENEEDIKEKLYSYVFKNAKENYYKTETGILNSVVLRYEKCLYFVKTLFNGNLMILKGAQGFQNYAFLYASVDQIEGMVKQIVGN